MKLFMKIVKMIILFLNLLSALIEVITVITGKGSKLELQLYTSEIQILLVFERFSERTIRLKPKLPKS
jgi:hypothetical protein